MGGMRKNTFLGDFCQKEQEVVFSLVLVENNDLVLAEVSLKVYLGVEYDEIRN